tara:strand:- start:6872 stop:7240 length:369 start_codon:yes stop_codon:yes gene_type:complete
MDVLLKEYIIRKEKCFTTYDSYYIDYICKNISYNDDELCLDCHGLLKHELDYFLEFIDSLQFKCKLKLITGAGRHSKKPIMDYYCSKQWKPPLKECIINYYKKQRKGYMLKEYETYMIITLK